MAVLYITEYVTQGKDNKGGVMAAVAEPYVAMQTVAIGAGSARSAALNVKTRLVRIHTDAICSIRFGAGAAVNAAATDSRLAAGQTEYFAVEEAQVKTAPGIAVAVIQNT